ncbi:MAG: trehalose-phosphatase [Pseudomonadota bacterium]
MMKILTAGLDLDLFFETLANTKQRVLMLDYDGTLAPFRIERDQAVPYPGVGEVLNSILKTVSCRVVLVTGRKAKDLIPLLGLSRIPEIWGAHGLERLFPDNRYEVADIDECPLRGLSEACVWAESKGLQGLCEQKPGCLALHWRGLGETKVKEIRDKIMANWLPIAQDTGLALHEFDGGLELRVPVKNKGSAVETILSEMGEDSVAAYLGDDLTDEDAFSAMDEKGLRILVRKEFRPTNADLWLRPPEELLEFLKKWSRACGGEMCKHVW